MRLVLTLGLLAVAACAAAPDDGAQTSSANDTTETTSGPLTPDSSFAGSGALSITGSSTALSAAARSDGAIAVARNRAGKDTVVTLVKSDGSASSDVVVPGAGNATTALVLTHVDGIVAVGSGAKFFLARIGADGNLDPKFRPDPLNIDVADAAVTKDGHIIVAGTLKTAAKAVVVRLSATGSVDASFGAQGAWIDDATATAATHAVVDPSGVVTFITVGANGTNALRLDATGKLDATYGRAGRASIAAVQPKHGSALVAGAQGAVTYVSSSATAESNSAFALDATGNVTSTTPVAGTVDGATVGGLESWEANADACTLHIGDTTAMFTAAQCSEPAPFVTLPDGRHAIAVTTPGTGTDASVAIHVFAP